MKIHILGICGTFMAGIAQLAKQAGHEVVGSDLNIYPPMSTQLISQGITLFDGYDPNYIDDQVDYIIVGNVIRRGNPAIEYILNKHIRYVSGPQWLAENSLCDRWVLAVAGTHGKTTTASMLAWILEYAGHSPGFLIGGVPENFGVSARSGESPYFVIEADEYDSAFFDKRSKFIHYHPKTLILNNLEFDHADIFPNLAAIQQQFHYLVRTVPENGQIICLKEDMNLNAVLDQGCWTPVIRFGEFGQSPADWQVKLIQSDGRAFEVIYAGKVTGQVKWDLLGRHNVSNGLAAIAAAHHAGIGIDQAIAALGQFKSVKRRLEIKGKKKGITLYDDFAHHPTAIATTLAGLRAHIGDKARIIAVLEFGSYTMRMGVHQHAMPRALQVADSIFCQRPREVSWDVQSILKAIKQPAALFDDVDSLVDSLMLELRSGDHVVVMSNSGFGGIHEKILGNI